MGKVPLSVTCGSCPMTDAGMVEVHYDVSQVWIELKVNQKGGSTPSMGSAGESRTPLNSSATTPNASSTCD
jgi:hypothetical protein